MKKTILVSADRGETRVAVLESKTKGGKRDVAELYIERRGRRSIVGNIYKGKVDNVLPGLEAAFVDIGLEKNGFLHVDEIVLPGVETPRRGRGSGGRKIADLLSPGQEVVVQVVKDPLKTKGARLSMELTIAGRYMVYAPTGEGVGVSRRLDDRERERLRRQTANLSLDSGGVIVRTAAHGAKRADFERELKYLHKLHEVLDKRVQDTAAPDLVFQEVERRKEAIHRLLVNARILADELRGLARDNQTEIGPALQQVDDLLDMLIHKEGQLKATLHAVGPYSAILGNIIGTGPWFDAYVFNLATIPTGEFQPGGLG